MSVQVSLIFTVYNEQQSIIHLLDSLAEQTRRPDEIVICDGGSDDGTIQVIQAYVEGHKAQFPNVHLMTVQGANISRGRNIAIEAAAGPIIACTDAGVCLAPEWLQHLVAPWEETSDLPISLQPLAVAGFFLPDASGFFQTAMAATVLPLTDDIDPKKFLPSSRSIAFTKQSWAVAGGYPEWLDYCEDLLFDLAINAQRPQQRTAFTWAPDAVAYFRPRGNITNFWTQYYRYARGDGKADLWRKRHALRYIVYLMAIPTLLWLGLFGQNLSWAGWLCLLAGVALYCWRPWLRLIVIGEHLNMGERLLAIALVPIIRAIGDLAKMVGYPVGLWWRWRHRQTQEIYWRKRLITQPTNQPTN